MHRKRRQILAILQSKGNATVDELSQTLDLTAVTVRHHLDVLRQEGWVAEPCIRNRISPGRPQHEYHLAQGNENPKLSAQQNLTDGLLAELRQQLGDETAAQWVQRAMQRNMPQLVDSQSLKQRLDQTVSTLNQKGYSAHWETHPEGALLHTCTCPYAGLINQHPEVCTADQGLVELLVGEKVTRTCHLANGGESCTYFIPLAQIG